MCRTTSTAVNIRHEALIVLKCSLQQAWCKSEKKKVTKKTCQQAGKTDITHLFSAAVHKEVLRALILDVYLLVCKFVGVGGYVTRGDLRAKRQEGLQFWLLSVSMSIQSNYMIEIAFQLQARNTPHSLLECGLYPSSSASLGCTLPERWWRRFHRCIKYN